MNKVIPIRPYLKNIPTLTSKESTPEERLIRIRASLEKINKLMNELRAMQHYGK